MASSSSSSSSKSESFDVFLSFRGEDTRRGFVSHLEKELKSKAINTFKDDEKLRTGDRISDELIRAIENSKFAVVVISKNYASSGWCLDELEKIIECQEKGMLTVVPIFYEMKPCDVRYQKGTFRKAFKKHNDRRSPEKVQKWREALNKVASLSGKDSRSSPDDATLVSEIVEDISKRLSSMLPKDFGDNIGMEAHMEVIDPLLNMGSDDEVRMVGIWGMGGVGKTTIAKCLYATYKCQFQFHCFISDIKKIQSEKGLETLQRLFLSKILRQEKLLSETIEIDSDAIKSRLCGQRVLAILDDVDDSDQLEALAKDTSWFGPGSRIIITTWGIDLFIKHGIELVYKVQCLGWGTAFRLFNHFVFGGKQVSGDLSELYNRALGLVKGHPLMIKVLGNALRGRKVKDWNAIIDNLAKTPNKRIMQCLKVSYEVLDDWDKDIFLTIACLFSGAYVRKLLRLLDDEDCEVYRSLHTLAEKALIDISEIGQVTVHDLIQDMAKEIIRQQSNEEPMRQRFLWDPNAVCNALVNGMGTAAIKGISLDISKVEDFPVRSESFENMPNLKFLVIRNTSHCRLDLSHLRNAINRLPPGLKLLDWENCPRATLPLAFKDLYLGKLRRLEFQSCLHLKEIPELPRNIVEIDLSGTNIRGMPEIQNLPTVKMLNLSWCRELLGIPNTIENLTSLQTLNLEHCSNLLEIPSSIGNLTALRELDLSSCQKLRSIPDTIGNLISLQTLSLYHCHSLLEIPSSIGNLTALGELFLSSCRKPTNILDGIGNLAALRRLNLSSCGKLRSIQDSIGSLPLVEDLDPSNCKSIRRIQDMMGNFSTLTSIKLMDCKMLSDISSMIGNFTTLQNLPSTIGNLNSLMSLEIVGWQMPMEIPSTIGNLTALEYLKLSGCTILSEIPSSIGNLRALTHLTIRNCKKLVSIPETVGNLTALEYLKLSGCTMLSEIPSSMGNLRALKHLTIRNCKKLGSIPETVGNLTALDYLNLSGCMMLSQIPSLIGNLTNLTSLALSGCSMHYDISSIISNMTSLQHLSPPEDIYCIWKIVKECLSKNLFSQHYHFDQDVIEAHWEMASGNQALEVFYLFRRRYDPKNVPCKCTNFSIFHDLRELSLRNLNIREIPIDFGYLQALQRLDLSGNDFEIIPASIKQFPLLEQLVLSHCRKIQSIPELSPGLKCLYANDCFSLESISNVYSHPFHELMLSDCFKLGEDLWQFIQRMIFSMPISKGEIKTWACFSAGELPAYFNHQSTEQQITIRCSRIDYGFKPRGFVAGIVVACGNFKELYKKRFGFPGRFYDVSHLNIHCRWRGEGYQSKHISFGLNNLPSHVSVTSAKSDLLFVFSCNFGEEKSCNMISFNFDLECEIETPGFRLCSIEELQQVHAIKRCGIRLYSTEELQQAQFVLPQTSQTRMQDINELVEEGNLSNLRRLHQFRDEDFAVFFRGTKETR